MSYIDLGLPSGTLWADSNETKFYCFDKAEKVYGNFLPSEGQFVELLLNTNHIWDKDNCGMRFQSLINDVEIFLPAEGWFDDILFTHHDNKNAGHYISSPERPMALDPVFYLDAHGCNISYTRSYSDGFSVRLVKSK